MLLATMVKGFKLIYGVGYNVREPLDWVFIVTAALAVVMALAAGVRGLVKVARREYYEPRLGEAADGPRRRTLASSATMILVALVGLSSISGTLASTDGRDRYETGLLDWGVLIIPAVGMVMLGLGVWASAKASAANGRG